MKIKISSEKDELSASMTKGLLEAGGIKVYIATDNVSLNPMISMDPNVVYSIFVEEDDVSAAKEILKAK